MKKYLVWIEVEVMGPDGETIEENIMLEFASTAQFYSEEDATVFAERLHQVGEYMAQHPNDTVAFVKGEK